MNIKYISLITLLALTGTSCWSTHDPNNTAKRAVAPIFSKKTPQLNGHIFVQWENDADRGQFYKIDTPLSEVNTDLRSRFFTSMLPTSDMLIIKVNGKKEDDDYRSSAKRIKRSL